MPDFLTAPFREEGSIDPWAVLLRLLVALLAGWIVSLVYRKTLHKPAEGSLPATLVLLAVLIAMITQVIGDSVARAFSLVGALSIVRFRTVVRDTRDTAFVIFAVVVGMAIGSQHFWVAAIGTCVVAIAAYVMFLGGRDTAHADHDHLLRVRASLDTDLETLVVRGLPLGVKCKILALTTAKQGTMREATFGLTLPSDRGLGETVNAIQNLPGVQDVRLVRRGIDAD